MQSIQPIYAVVGLLRLIGRVAKHVVGFPLPLQLVGRPRSESGQPKRSRMRP